MNRPSLEDLFPWQEAADHVSTASHGVDDCELFAERSRSESLSWSDGRLLGAGYREREGFAVRVVDGEAIGFGLATGFDPKAIKRASATAMLARGGHSTHADVGPARTNQKAYRDVDPIDERSVTVKIEELQHVDGYARAKDPRVMQVSASTSAERREIAILRAGGERYLDARPMVQATVTVTVEQGGRRESGSASIGARAGYAEVLSNRVWEALADKALRLAIVKLDSVPGPVGELDVVLGPGWPGMMLHEAVGHGLEGDFNRKGSSIYAGRIGERIAAPGVTIMDDGTIPGARGSLTFDDEGTPAQCNVLVEDGILKAYMQDRQNGRFAGTGSSGNARRESYSHAPMPRMTNTFMAAGSEEPAEIIARMKKGIYATQLGSGEVDPTSGKFMFQCDEAYLVENGRIVAPLKGSTLIGDGLRVLQGIKAIGNDLEIDAGRGMCGKGGQTLPVSVGMPTVYVTGLTVGSA